MQGMSDDKRLLSSKNAEYLRLIEQRAEAERVYNIAVAEKTLYMKSEGHPVSILRDIVRGDKFVAGLKKNLDIADGITKACHESMKDVRASIDSARSYLSWLKAEMQSQ
jgi:hypothetical protein